MTAATDDRRKAVVGLAERIGTVTIVTGAVTRMRAGGWRTLALWLAIAVAGWGMQAVAAAAGVNIAGLQPGPAYFVYLLASAVVSGAGAALGLRLFVRGNERWLEVDRPLLIGGGAMAGATLAFGGVSMLSVLATRSGDPGVMAMGSLAFSLGYLVLIFVALKLTLWPVGVVMARSELNVRRSWTLMGKATRGLVFGYLIFMLPFGIVMAGNWTDLAAGRSPEGWRQGLFVLVGAAYGVAAYAMSATIYALRVESPATVADVFD